jgi:hypothetical protein
MPTEIDTLDKVPETNLKKLMKDFAQDQASIVTAINDGKGTFTVEATFLDGGLHAVVTKSGKMSTFGGPDDLGVAPDEGLSLYDSSEVAGNPDLFPGRTTRRHHRGGETAEPTGELSGMPMGLRGDSQGILEKKHSEGVGQRKIG